MLKICEIVVGSKLYGLDTPESDTDVRGVFLHTDYADILGISKEKVVKNTNSEEDSVFMEFRHYLKQLYNTNTFAIELLYAPSEKFSFTTHTFDLVRSRKNKLVDSDKLYKSLTGYIHNEIRLANGERMGDIGSKRREKINTYGFSPKNFSHMIRLAHCGAEFFRTGDYPVVLDGHIRDLVFDIKVNPENYTKAKLNYLAVQYFDYFKKCYTNSTIKKVYDSGVANLLCLTAYYPFLTTQYELEN